MAVNLVLTQCIIIIIIWSFIQHLSTFVFKALHILLPWQQTNLINIRILSQNLGNIRILSQLPGEHTIRVQHQRDWIRDNSSYQVPILQTGVLRQCTEVLWFKPCPRILVNQTQAAATGLEPATCMLQAGHFNHSATMTPQLSQCTFPFSIQLCALNIILRVPCFPHLLISI